MPQSDPCSFRSKWENENEETAISLLSADSSAAPPCYSPIARSWQRCKELGLVRATRACMDLISESELKRRKDDHQTLLQLAANEFSILQRAITGADGNDTTDRWREALMLKAHAQDIWQRVAMDASHASMRSGPRRGT